jgi:hypothetical protein
MKTRWLILSAGVALGLLWSCELDQGLGPSMTKISGRVIFHKTGTLPGNIAEVRVVAVASLPPSGFGDVYQSEKLSKNLDTAAFKIAVPVGTYPALGVLWKPANHDWSIANILGIYDVQLHTLPLVFSLKSLQVAEEYPVIDTLNIHAYWDFAQFNARIDGELTLSGGWPPDTYIVLMGAYTEIPENLDLNSLAAVLATGFPLPVSSGAVKRSFGLAVKGGAYKFIGIFWTQSRRLDGLRLVGYYRDPQDGSRPGAITLEPGGSAIGINITADFSTLPNGLRLPSRR